MQARIKFEVSFIHLALNLDTIFLLLKLPWCCRCTTWFKTLSRKLFLLTMCQPKREPEEHKEASPVDQI